jgi:hypothetical protein
MSKLEELGAKRLTAHATWSDAREAAAEAYAAYVTAAEEASAAWAAYRKELQNDNKRGVYFG